MDDAFKTLQLPTSASSEEIRQRYLELVRQYTPERSPERFAEISAAYESLKDPVERIRRRLFLTTTDSIQAIADDAEQHLGGKRIPADILLSLGGE